MIYKSPTASSGFDLRAVPKLLGIQADPLEQGREDPNFNFYIIEGDLGYNVPHEFWDYISQHSGFEVFGKPITAFKQISESLSRQCFENICLDLQKNAPEGTRVRPMTLGYNYQNMLKQTGVLSDAGNSYAGVQLTIWESNPVINADDQQVISAMVTDGGSPLRNVELSLSVFLPDGSQLAYGMAPTGQDGSSSIQIEPINQKNGTYIEYQVCVSNLDALEKCAQDAFLIWKTP